MKLCSFNLINFDYILSGQGIALRGHNEDSESVNSNPGNFIALLEMFTLEYPTQRDHMKKPLLKNATYIRHHSQNEIIEVRGLPKKVYFLSYSFKYISVGIVSEF